MLSTAMPRSSPQRATLRLVCWKTADADRRAAELRRASYRVIADPLANPGGAVRYFSELNPDAVVIDLDRLPSHGRELGMSLRASRSTCHLPLIFAGGIGAGGVTEKDRCDPSSDSRRHLYSLGGCRCRN
jgi:hypothetical protein